MRLLARMRRGRITIPGEFRAALGLAKESTVSLTLEGRKLVMRPQPNPNWFRELYDVFAPVREALKHVPEQKINDVIDAAVKEVRSRPARD